MKTKKLLENLKNHMIAERRDQLAKYDSIKHILKKLKKKENALKEELKEEQDEKARSRLQQEIDVIFAQRKKGVKLRKELKEAKES